MVAWYCCTMLPMLGVNTALVLWNTNNDWCPLGSLRTIPSEILYRDVNDDKLPAFRYDIGETKLRIHYLNKFDIYDFSNLVVTYYDLFTGEEKVYTGVISKDKCATFDMSIIGTTRINIESDFHELISCYIDPCIDNEVWIDMLALKNKRQFIFSSGRLDAMNRAMSIYSKFVLPFTDPNVESYLKNDIITFCKHRENELYRRIQAIDISPLPILWKRLYIERSKEFMIGSIMEFDNNRYFITGEMDRSVDLLKTCSDYIHKIDWDYELFLFTVTDGGKNYIYSKPVLKDAFQFKIQGFVNSFWGFINLYQKYNNNLINIKCSEYERLSKFYKDAYNYYLKTQIEDNNDNSSHKIGSIEYLNDILHQNGCQINRRLIILFWGVNCGACELEVDEIRKLEPLNDTKVIYITTPYWSPYKRWRNQIKEMNGEHYYVSQADWDRMLAQYNTKGIPLTLFVNPSGDVVPKYGYMTSEQIMDEINKFRH